MGGSRVANQAHHFGAGMPAVVRDTQIKLRSQDHSLDLVVLKSRGRRCGGSPPREGEVVQD